MNKQLNTSIKQNTSLDLVENKLYQFSQTSQAQFSRQALEGSATSATIICAFFMGAAKTFASNEEHLQRIIAELISMDERGTRHLIDTTRRLEQKYSFVNELIKFGQQTAASSQDNHKQTLAQLLQQNQNQSLMAMVKRGTIQSQPITARANANLAVEKNPRLKRLLIILLALIILVTANFLILKAL